MVSAANSNSATSPSAPGSRPALSGSPVVHEAAVVATGARTDEATGKRELFKENTSTALVFPNGGVIRLSVPVGPGQLIFLTNTQSRREVVAQVTRRRNNPSAGFYVELEFTEPSPGFWGIAFPEAPADTNATPAAAPQEQPAPPDLAPAAAEFLQPAEPGSDDLDLSPNAPAPSAGEVQALVEEIEALREQLRSMQTQAAQPPPAPAVAPAPPAQSPQSAPAAASPVAAQPSAADQRANSSTATVVSATAFEASTPPQAEAPTSALPQLQLSPVLSKTAPPQSAPSQPNAPNDEDLLPKPALDFNSSKAPLAFRGPAPSGDRAGLLRLALLAVVSLFAVMVAAWNMHWLPWGSAKTIPASSTPAPNAVSAKPSTPRPASQPKPAGASTTAGAQSLATDTNSPSASAASVSDSSAQPAAAAAADSTSANTTNDSPSPDPASSDSAAKHAAHAKDAASVVSISKRSDLRAPNAADNNSAPVSANDDSITPPRLIKSVRAVAPGDALRQFMTGNVTLDALIDKTGEVKSMKVLSGPPGFHKAAMEALKQYRYEPARQNGKAVSAHLTVTVPFWFEP